VAVVGASGLVGKVLLGVMEERRFPASELTLVGSRRSVGAAVRANGVEHALADIESEWHLGQDIVFFVTDGGVAKEEIPRLRGSVPLIIDNSATFRMEPDVPLVVPQVNADAAYAHRGLIANPNCSTIQLVVAVLPIHLLSPVRRLIVSTYQAASGAGRGFMERFWQDTASDCGRLPNELSGTGSSLAFNLLPSIDTMMDDGFSREEEKIMRETKKIFSDDRIAVSATAVRVPVVNSHSESVYLETEEALDLDVVERALQGASGVTYVKDHFQATPRFASGRDSVLVSRLRRDRERENGLHLWVVADNLRKGAATNAVEIAELFVGKIHG
jgi:aspartate-semialdehyde dehydrogenase